MDRIKSVKGSVVKTDGGRTYRLGDDDTLLEHMKPGRRLNVVYVNRGTDRFEVYGKRGKTPLVSEERVALSEIS